MPIILDPSTPPPPSAAVGYTLGQYRRRLADTAGFNIQTVTTGQAQVPEQVLVNDFRSTELEPTFLGNTWEYQPTGTNAGEIRRVVYGGLANGTGVVTLERQHSTLTGIGVPIEFYGKVPPVRYEGRLGLNDIVNKVLAECWTVQRIAIAAVQDQKIYRLGTLFPWLLWEDQIVEVYSRSATAQPNDDDQLMLAWRWMSGADNPGIELGTALNTGDILKIELFLPMSWWTNTGAGFGLAASEGLRQETDLGILPLMGMEIVGASYIYGEQAKWGLPEDQQRFLALRAQARAASNQYKRLTLERPLRRRYHWPSVLTVRTRDNYGYGYAVMTRG